MNASAADTAQGPPPDMITRFPGRHCWVAMVLKCAEEEQETEQEGLR